MTIKEKILSFIETQGIKKGEFFEAIGVAPSNFKGTARQSELGGDKIAKILTLHPELSPDWLLADRGEMLRPTPHSPTNNELQDNTPVAIRATKPGEGIPLIPVSAMAGALTDEHTVLEYECERYVIPVFRGADFLIPLKGSSMYPKYSSGDIVACKRVAMSDLFFQWNKVYVLDTKQGALIKRIKPGSDKDHILIVSDNKDYDPFELPYSAINAVALVIGVIRLE